MIPVIFSATLIIEGIRTIEQAATSTPAAAPMPQTWVAAFYMIAVLLIGQIGIWIREILKYKDFRKRNGQLDLIRKNAVVAAEKAAEAATVAGETRAIIGMMQKNCATTTARFSSEIQATTSRLIDHISKG